MTEQTQVLNIINENYPMDFDAIEFVRDSGCVAYTVYASGCKYFLRITKPMFFETATKSLDIHLFLQKQNFAVPRIIFTKGGLPCLQVSDEEGDCFYVIYEFLEGEEVDPEQDAEEIGAFIGKLHSVMKDYPGELTKNDKHYYLDRYIDIMRTKQYERTDEFITFGEALWKRVKDLPYGYCHGDMYRGNIMKTSDGHLYILDFDTSCEGFPMYDLALICNITDYFELEDDGYMKSKRVYEWLLPEYLKYSSLTRAETEAFYDLIALYHFALQATIIEIFGIDCVDNEFLDRQLGWLNEWQEQCEQNRDDLVSKSEKK